MQIKLEPLSQGDKEMLLRWLEEPACDVFCRVVESEAFKIECESVVHAMLDTDAGTAASKGDIVRAIKTRYVLELMKRYRSETDFKTATALPSKAK